LTEKDAMAARIYLPAVIALAALMAGCASTPDQQRSSTAFHWPRLPGIKPARIDATLPALPAAGSGRGGYYKDDGPGEDTPPNLRDVPDAQFKAEPLSRFANRPYAVFGKTYVPIVHNDAFTQRGVASWYGKKFHGQRTSSGELYDMYKMSAAHPTLPIPSYARVTSLESGKQVVVRINDRGPFHASRVIDVSYTAALKLGLLSKGSHAVTVERVLPDDPARIATVRREAGAAAGALNAAAPPPAISALMLEDRLELESAAQVQAQALAPGPAAPEPGYYLQLGAYGGSAAAEELSRRMTQLGIGRSADVVQAGSVFRVFSGPFATRAEAGDAMRRLPTELRLKPLVVKR
jgi:rare lipoprotein A